MVRGFFRRSIFLAALAAGLGPLVPVGAAPGIPVLREFGDWVIGCDNLGGCTAIGTVPENSEWGGFLLLTRAAGGKAPALAKVVIWTGEREEEKVPVRLSVDGGAVPGLGPVVMADPVEADFADTLEIRLSPEQFKALIAAARSGLVLTAARPDADPVEISLSGAMAALLFMDDVQGRLGTVTALVRPGSLPATAVPAPPAAPIVDVADLAETSADPALLAGLSRRAEREADCEPFDADFAAFDAGPGSGEGKLLIGLTCLQGAYNFSSVFYLVEGGDVEGARRVTFPEPDGDGAVVGARLLVNAQFDDEHNEITAFSKGRGLADCGSWGFWAWDGSEFRLMDYSAMWLCRGVPSEYWPTLWRARVR